MPSALDQLTGAYRDGAPLPAGRPLIGVVGADVPVELITAAGGVPLRLRGDPSLDPAPGRRYLGGGLDPVAWSILTRLLAGSYGRLDRLVLCHDSEASLRLFYALREMHRIDPGRGLPPAYLVDILHLPHRTTAAYNLTMVRKFAARLGSSTSDLPASVTAHDLRRRLLGEVARLRRSVPARLTGAEFLAVAGAPLPVDRHVALLQRLLAESGGLPEHTGTRVFLTGSDHDNDAVYRALEDDGYLVVGEDHAYGELGLDRLVGAPTLDAIAERYHYPGPSAQRATVDERAAWTAAAATSAKAELLISYVRRNDEAPAWDFPAQRELFPNAVLLEHQEYGRIERVAR